ncbi:uncharacterized protein LOC100679554 isoform X2 [Nasonia vitripennis]|uniref:Uncharacterized protein n=1 Tax=Nasonia vitripennis TaxID=7425 RepID=A0A7M7IYG7_NASVI|nr:uncharacterized protein LOC100679554 isoform X2 [Nasonia vitripennis]
MPHCTRHLGWYVGKFLVGLTGMLFIYFNYLREKNFECVCPMRDRELARQKASEKTAVTVRKGCGRTRDTNATVSDKRHKIKTKQAKRATTAAQASVAAQDAAQLTSQWHDVIKRKLCRIVDRIERAIKKQIEPPPKLPHLPPVPEPRKDPSTCRRCYHRKLRRWRTRRFRSSRRSWRHCGTTSTTTETIQVNEEEDTSTSSIIGCSNNTEGLTSSASVQRAIQDMEQEFQKTLMELERLDQTFAIPEESATVDESSLRSSTIESFFDKPDVFSSTRLPGGAVKHFVSRDLGISKNSCRKQVRLNPDPCGKTIPGKPTRDSLREKRARYIQSRDIFRHLYIRSRR